MKEGCDMGKIKIVIPYGMPYIPMDLLEEYAGDVYVIKYGNSNKNDTPFHMINIHNPDVCIGRAPVRLGCGRYNELMKMSDEIKKKIDVHWDQVLVITDGTAESMLIVKLLQKQFTGCCGRIHLWAFIPFVFSRRDATIKEYNQMLDELTEIQSFAVTDLNDYISFIYDEKNYQESMKRIHNMTGPTLKAMLTQFSNMIKYNDSYKYFFDNSEKRYVVTNDLRMVEKERVHRIMGLAISNMDGAENKGIAEMIARPRVRVDGKEVCEELRRLRRRFALENGLDYEFRVCSYEGPCAGTCDYCEYETKELYELALLKVHGDVNKVIFPKENLSGRFSAMDDSKNDDENLMFMGEVQEPLGKFKVKKIKKKEWGGV